MAAEAPRGGGQSHRVAVMVLAGAVIWMTIQVFQHFAPGAMSPDSISMLTQARTNVFEDGHPPLVTWIWQWLDRLVPGPQPLLVLHLLLFYGGLFLIFAAVARTYHAMVLPVAVAIGLWPPVIGILGTIWTDVTMAAFFLFAIGLWLQAANTRRPELFYALSLACVALAVGSRHNAAAAAGPLLVLFVLHAVLRGGRTAKRVVLACVLGGALTIALFASVKIASNQLVDKPRHLWRATALYDIAGTSYYSGTNLFEDGLVPNASWAAIRHLYSPRSYFPLATGEQIHPVRLDQRGTMPPLAFDESRADLNARILKNWTQVIVHHPGAYLQHRADFFVSMVQRKPWGLWAPVFDAIYPNDLGVPARRATDSWYFAFVRDLSGTSLIFEPVLYLALSAVLVIPVLAAGLRSGSRTLLLASALYASSLAHTAGLFLFAVTPDFRYSHWPITSSALATVLLALVTVRWLSTRLGQIVAPPSGSPSHT